MKRKTRSGSRQKVGNYLTTSLNIPVDLLARIDAIAVDQHRSRTKQAVLFLEQAVSQFGTAKAA